MCSEGLFWEGGEARRLGAFQSRSNVGFRTKTALSIIWASFAFQKQAQRRIQDIKHLLVSFGPHLTVDGLASIKLLSLLCVFDSVAKVYEKRIIYHFSSLVVSFLSSFFWFLFSSPSSLSVTGVNRFFICKENERR